MRNSFSFSQAFVILTFLSIYLLWAAFASNPDKIVPTKTVDTTAYAIPFLPENPIDLNTANFYDLQLLPFIGRGYATKILEYRKKQGGFKEVYELKNILRMDSSKFEKLKAYVIVP
jgi:DNA uptake protein ComE-like DNA-binding protein